MTSRYRIMRNGGWLIVGSDPPMWANHYYGTGLRVAVDEFARVTAFLVARAITNERYAGTIELQCFVRCEHPPLKADPGYCNRVNRGCKGGGWRTIESNTVG